MFFREALESYEERTTDILDQNVRLGYQTTELDEMIYQLEVNAESHIAENKQFKTEIISLRKSVGDRQTVLFAIVAPSHNQIIPFHPPFSILGERIAFMLINKVKKDTKT